MKLWIFTTFIFLTLSQGLHAKSCLSFFESAEKTYTNQFAEHFEIKTKSNLTLILNSDQSYRVFFRETNDVPPECENKSVGQVDSIIPTSTSMLHFFSLLKKEKVVQGFPGTRYITSPSLQKRVEKGLIQELGDSSSLETLILMNPDLILTQGRYSVSATGLERYQEVADKNFSFLEFKESHPLARAEWIVPLATILGDREQGIALFEDIKKSYQTTLDLVEKSKTSQKVLVGAFFQGRWFSPAPGSDFVQLLKDAGAQLVTPSSKVGLNFESVLLHSKKADFWLPQASWQTREESIAMDERHLILLEEFSDSKIFALKKKSQGLEFWEKGVARPDLVLKDLAQVFGHSPDTELNFYTSLQSTKDSP